MKEYLKMRDVFDVMPENKDAQIEQILIDGLSTREEVTHATHAINSHDELVAEVERLRMQLQHAFMAGWEEGVNGMECDEAEIASVEIANQFSMA